MSTPQPDREKLMQKFLQFPSETLAEIAAELVLDAAQESTKAMAAPGGTVEYRSFAHWLETGIRDHRFPELRRFRVEGQKAYLMFQNREIEITHQMESWPENPAASPLKGEQPGGEQGRHAKNNPVLTKPPGAGPAPELGRFKNLEL